MRDKRERTSLKTDSVVGGVFIEKRTTGRPIERLSERNGASRSGSLQRAVTPITNTK